MNFKTSIRNYGTIAALLSMVVLTTDLTGITIPYLSVLLDNQQWIQGLLGLFVALGIINNPTTENKWFLEDK